MEDPFRLQRFVDAQARDYDRALAELRAGQKTTHWIWYVFPQVAGLGRSPTAQEYALSGRDEAVAYLRHPVLGPRLRECAQALVDLGRRDPEAVLGGIDAVKLRSSMTLFEAVAPEEAVFGRVLDQYFHAERDPATLQRL